MKNNKSKSKNKSKEVVFVPLPSVVISSSSQGKHTHPDYSFRDALSRKREFFCGDVGFPDVVSTGTQTKPKSKSKQGSKDYIQEQWNAECTKETFSLAPHQRFLCNFMAPGTPYNGLLLFHGTGGMKTCTAVSICEGFDDRQVFLIARPTLHDNFLRTVYDSAASASRKHQCGGSRYHQSNNRGDILVREKYTCFGIISFANLVSAATDRDLDNQFSGSIIVVDEAHHLRNSQMESAFGSLQRVLRVASNIKLLLLTATPMFNSNTDVLPLLNLLHTNDRETINDMSDIASAARGYVSYFPGRSPFSFPKILTPSVATHIPSPFGIISARSKSMRKQNRDIVTLDAHGTRIPKSDRLETLMYRLKQQGSHGSVSEVDEICTSEMSGLQLETYEAHRRDFKADDVDDDVDHEVDHEVDDDVDHGDMRVRQMCNVIFPAPLNGGGDSSSSGKAGFRRCMEFDPQRGAWKYRPGVPAFLSPELAPGYACKINNVADCIAATGRSAISMVYSRWIWSGVLPVAVALEHRGYRSFSDTGYRGGIGTYAIISGLREHGFQSLERILEVARSPENKHGELISVLLITDRGTEGLDFRFVRELHILEPWFHMKKIEQIVGRAVRHCSHALLQSPERNVTVYMHASVYPRGGGEMETADLQAYRIALKKEIDISKAESALISVAIDFRHDNNDPRGEREKRTFVVDMVSASGRTVKTTFLSRKEEDDDTCDTLAADDSTFDAVRHVDLSRVADVILATLRSADATHGCTIEDFATALTKKDQMQPWVAQCILEAVDRLLSHRVFRRTDKYFLGNEAHNDDDESNTNKWMPLNILEHATKAEGAMDMVARRVVALESSLPSKVADRFRSEILDYVVDRLPRTQLEELAVVVASASSSSTKSHKNTTKHNGLAQHVRDSLIRAGVLENYIDKKSLTIVFRNPYDIASPTKVRRPMCFVPSDEKNTETPIFRPCIVGEIVSPTTPESSTVSVMDDPYVKLGFMDRVTSKDVFTFKLATTSNVRGSVCGSTSSLRTGALWPAILRIVSSDATLRVLLEKEEGSLPRNKANMCLLIELAMRKFGGFMRPVQSHMSSNLLTHPPQKKN